MWLLALLTFPLASPTAGPGLELVVDMDPREQLRVRGERFEANCTATADSLKITAEWVCPPNSSCTVVDTRGARGELYRRTQQLLIPAVMLSDSGNFTCTGYTFRGMGKTFRVTERKSDTISLQVLEKGFVQLDTEQNQTLEVDVGESLELRVGIEAYPRLSHCHWVHEDAANGSHSELLYRAGENRYVCSLPLVRLKVTESGNYTCFTSNSEANGSLTFRVLIKQKPVVTLRHGEELECRAVGYPPPIIHWYQCPGFPNSCTELGDASALHLMTDVESRLVSQAPDGVTEVMSSVSKAGIRINSTLECFASNKAGADSKVFSITAHDQPITPFLASAVAVAMTLTLLLAILLYKYKQKPKYEIRWKIIEAVNGNDYIFLDPSHLPYSEKWEFPRENLCFGKILGAGAFGKVMEATAYGLGEEETGTKVAVKMLKPRAHSTEKEALMSELKILSHLGQHNNVVNLLGACTQGGPVLVITEYCCYGDLLNYLKHRAEYLTSSSQCSDYRNLCMWPPERVERGKSYDGYLPMRPSVSSNCPLIPEIDCKITDDDVLEAEETLALDMEQLLNISHQVAHGMDFLSSRNCIHRDVAARNVLLTHGRVAKICDFGLARDIMNDSNYVVKGNARLPVKWMAPESIFDCVYTVQSDVWSYGILLWEIFSLGSSPYPDLPVDSRFYKLIRSGYQMSRPVLGTPEMYDVMSQCWHLDPHKRPTFQQIRQMINKQLDWTVEQDDSTQPLRDELPGRPACLQPAEPGEGDTHTAWS
ncbi:macrophage colony-stimulating factor 1 receptor isoform X1 [Callorhinchus milii]|uniref:macrophage colony-stimulating factor 1 receptor isoform X1 n=1 Tax=Callorhinchus milii TaxID=7868 RepID=UPI001C3F4F92|nr:macrophage colony-stimulating factor 1 receptor isoform X1 [Callorhinchus milii]